MIAEPSSAFEALLSATQAASLLNLHPNTLLLWAREGKVPCLRLGRRVAFRASSLNQWLSEQYTNVAVRAAHPKGWQHEPHSKKLSAWFFDN
jgi:excisionase family DNA binding protein